MAVEKMKMLNMVGHMDCLDRIAKTLVLSSTVHMVNAISEVQQSNFPILHARDELDAVIDYNYIKQYSSSRNLGRTEEKIRALTEIFDMKNKIYSSFIEEDYDFERDEVRADQIYEIIRYRDEQLKALSNEREKLVELEEYINSMKHINVDISSVFNMKYINVKLGKLSRHNMDKLKKNYENISAIALKLYSDNDNAVVMLFVPENIEEEVSRVLKSLSFEEYRPEIHFEGTPEQWLDAIEKRKLEIKNEVKEIKKDILQFKNEFEKDIRRIYSRLMLEYKIEELKSNIVCTNEFFYLIGWIPNYKKQELSDALEEYEDRLILVFKEPKDSSDESAPPTCMKNPRLLKPFESVVKMYGIPSYGELDPTIFLGLSYMLLFGAMFGDVGQGAVLFLGGLFLIKYKKRPNLGGVLSRLGFSSVIFGFLYGSIFGFEDVLKGFIIKPIKPMENLNLMLVSGVAIGVLFLTIGFIYNFINSYRKRDIKNGLFSRNGLAGFILYWLLLYYAASMIIGKKPILTLGAVMGISAFLLALILFREPLAHLIQGVRPLYSESKADYYIEEGFGVVETLLTFLSNTLSFIRVGAFAINHVGLFIAFETLSHMVGKGIPSVLVLILGNVMIIGLEGLIVFIQGLRLEYYELFGKYYVGIGYEYSPCRIKIHGSNFTQSPVIASSLSEVEAGLIQTTN